MISAQYLSLSAVFINYITSFVDILNLVFYVSVVICQEKKDFTGLLSLSYLTFQIFWLAIVIAVA